MNITKMILPAAALAVAFFAGAPKADAYAMLATSSSAAPTDETANVGTLVELGFQTNLALPLSGTFAGTLNAGVYRDLAGYLVFAYQTHNQPGINRADAITRITGVDFAGFTTSVGYTTGTLGSFTTAGTVAPTMADRNAVGNTVGFDFASGVPTNAFSDIILVSTNAMYYKVGFVSEVDGGTYTGFAFAPDVPPQGVPEPGTYLLFAGGLAAVGFIKRGRG